jgi:hypothetical protein
MITIDYIIKIAYFLSILYVALDYIFNCEVDNTVGYIILTISFIAVIGVFYHSNKCNKEIKK